MLSAQKISQEEISENEKSLERLSELRREMIDYTQEEINALKEAMDKPFDKPENEEWIEDFRSFWWEVGKYEKRKLGIDSYIIWIDELLQKEREEDREQMKEDIRSVKNMLGMMENEVDRKKIENFIDEYLLKEQ
jgi:hypothetical protein